MKVNNFYVPLFSMSTLEAMPKANDTVSVQAHLKPDLYAEFVKEATKRDWSNKKLAENIIKWYFEELKKGKGGKK